MPSLAFQLRFQRLSLWGSYTLSHASELDAGGALGGVDVTSSSQYSGSSGKTGVSPDSINTPRFF